MITRKKVKDRDWLVVPVTMLVEGTHAGSNGPLYYPRAELAKSAALWEGVPIVVNHPTCNGELVSAYDPCVTSDEFIGYVRRPRMANDRRLVAEAWLDVLKTPQSIVQALLGNRVLEVSTGVFTDNVRVRYEMWATNLGPDHLAILPDTVGACSIEKGCGLAVA